VVEPRDRDVIDWAASITGSAIDISCRAIVD
jgi:hypothetical protein